ncbi:MAG TPA: class I tRNA ligase family protein, partial [Longimicrobiaceae bacterium]|nr:class I tRNA ligase family protein [Longimicrobiaceae bacterium]
MVAKQIEEPPATLDEVPTVLTAAFPFVPGRVTLAHVASTYLPADVTRRFWTVLGERVSLISATDVHSVQASEDGKTRRHTEERCDAAHLAYRAAFAALGIEFDVYERTDHPAHVAHVQGVLSGLHKRNLLHRAKRWVTRCANCLAYPPPRLTGRQDGPPRCPFCGSGALEEVESGHWFFRLEPHRNAVHRFAENQVQNDVRGWISSALREPLRDWNITRDNVVGLPLSFASPHQSLYLWVESLIAYVSFGVQVREPPLRFAHFIGKNILLQHCVMWPVLAECGLPEVEWAKISARGFLDLNGSDPELVEIDEALARVPPDYLRFWLTLLVPDKQVDFRFKREELRIASNSILCHRVGNLLRRATIALHQGDHLGRTTDLDDPLCRRFWDETVPAIRAEISRLRPRAAAQAAMAYLSHLTREFAARELYGAPSAERNGLLAFMIASALTVLSPIVPTLAAEYGVFEGWTPGSVSDIARAVARPLAGTGAIWSPLSAWNEAG